MTSNNSNASRGPLAPPAAFAQLNASTSTTSEGFGGMDETTTLVNIPRTSGAHTVILSGPDGVTSWTMSPDSALRCFEMAKDTANSQSGTGSPSSLRISCGKFGADQKMEGKWSDAALAGFKSECEDCQKKFLKGPW